MSRGPQASRLLRVSIPHWRTTVLGYRYICDHIGRVVPGVHVPSAAEEIGDGDGGSPAVLCDEGVGVNECLN